MIFKVIFVYRIFIFDSSRGSAELRRLVFSKATLYKIYEIVEKHLSDDKDSEKTLGNTCASGATKNVSDIVFWGDGDTFKLISKASSQKEGWMKSTKCCQMGGDVVVQVTTQQRNSDGSYAVAEALTTVTNAEIVETTEDGIVVSRKVVSK